MTSSTSSSNRRFQLENTLRGSATALFIVAGFAVLDLVFVLAALPLRITFDLSIFQATEGVWPLPMWAGLGLGLAAVFATLGWFGRLGHSWAFAVGIGLYTLDGGLALARGDLVNSGAHLFVLFILWLGFSTARELRALPPVPQE